MSKREIESLATEIKRQYPDIDLHALVWYITRWVERRASE